MRWPDNSTGLSVAGVVKWFLIIDCAVFLFKAYQGLIQRKTATGGGNRVGEYLTGDEAIKLGLQHLGLAVAFGAAAWVIWFFWQRHEE